MSSSQDAGKAAVSMTRAAVQHLQAQSTATDAVESMALELLAQDDAVQVTRAIVALAGLAASAIIVLAGTTGRSTEELLDGFARGIDGWKPS